jgi:hypothetical protein
LLLSISHVAMMESNCGQRLIDSLTVEGFIMVGVIRYVVEKIFEINKWARGRLRSALTVVILQGWGTV